MEQGNETRKYAINLHYVQTFVNNWIQYLNNLLWSQYHVAIYWGSHFQHNGVVSRHYVTPQQMDDVSGGHFFPMQSCFVSLHRNSLFLVMDASKREPEQVTFRAFPLCKLKNKCLLSPLRVSKGDHLVEIVFTWPGLLTNIPDTDSMSLLSSLLRTQWRLCDWSYLSASVSGRKYGFHSICVRPVSIALDTWGRRNSTFSKIVIGKSGERVHNVADAVAYLCLGDRPV